MKVKLEYTVLEYPELNKILDFVNSNYIHPLVYSLDLIEFYCKDSIILEYKYKKTVVGYIVGKKKRLNLNSNQKYSIEVNFFCLIEKLRGLGLSSFMIGSLQKECMSRYNIGVAHYTVQSDIKIKPYCRKDFYHRPINIDTLSKANFFNQNINIEVYKKAFNSFNTDSSKYVKFYNGSLPHNVNELYLRYFEYQIKTYLVYEYTSIHIFKETFLNKAFSHFIVYDKEHRIQAYFCLYKIDNRNGYSSGILYYLFLQDNLISSFELLCSYIHSNKIYDTITFTDLFNVNYTKIKCIPGTGYLNYYLFNTTSEQVLPCFNGLVTI